MLGMQTVYRIETASVWRAHLRDAEGVLYESRDLAIDKIRHLERIARNLGFPHVLFQLREIDMASEAAKELGRKGGTTPAGPGKKRGRPRTRGVSDHSSTVTG